MASDSLSKAELNAKAPASRSRYREQTTEAPTSKVRRETYDPKKDKACQDACLNIREHFTIRPKQPRKVLTQKLYVELKKYIYERDGWCLFCGTTERLTPAHYKRRSQGGHDAPNNLFCACVDCHKAFDDGGNNPPKYITDKLPEIIEMLEMEAGTWEKI